MKTISAQILILLIAFSFQGCFFGGDLGYYHETINTQKFMKERNYKEDMPFVMEDHSINAPLISQKGQVNCNFKINNGITSHITVAVSDKVFVEGGLTYAKNNIINGKSATFEITEYPSSGNSYIYSSTRSYDQILNFKSVTFFAGVGMYKTFSKYGRWENHAGISYGNASSNYTYEFSAPGGRNYFFEEKRNVAAVFAQTDFGYVTRRTEGAIIARANLINYFNQNFANQPYISTYEMKKNQLLIQPGLQFAYGGSFRMFTQVNWNIPIGNSDVKWNSVTGKLGILLKFGEKISPEKK